MSFYCKTVVCSDFGLFWPFLGNFWRKMALILLYMAPNCFYRSHRPPRVATTILFLVLWWFWAILGLFSNFWAKNALKKSKVQPLIGGLNLNTVLLRPKEGLFTLGLGVFDVSYQCAHPPDIPKNPAKMGQNDDFCLIAYRILSSDMTQLVTKELRTPTFAKTGPKRQILLFFTTF